MDSVLIGVLLSLAFLAYCFLVLLIVYANLAAARIEGQIADMRETVERIDADLRSDGVCDSGDSDEEPEDKFWERN